MSRRERAGLRWLGYSAGIGFTSLSLQTACFKILFMFFVESTVATSIAIGTYLAGLVGGNLIASKIRARADDLPRMTLWTVAASQAASALYASLVLRDTGLAWSILGLQSSHPRIGYLVISLYLAPIGLLAGVCMPLLLACYLREQEAGERGRPAFHEPSALVLAWDTAGSILGCAVCGVWLIPRWGYGASIQATSAAAIALSLLAVRGLPRAFQAALAAVAVWVLSSAAWEASASLRPKEPVYFRPPGGELERVLFQKESPFGTVRVTSHRAKRLWINSRSLVSNGQCNSEKELARLAMRQLEQKFPGGELRVLNIGLGGGLTASEILKTPRARVYVSEINPVIVEAARRLWDEENHGLLRRENERRVRLLVENGLHTLAKSPAGFWHAVVIDVEEPTIVYSSGLYTVEAFRLMREKMVEGGVVALWAQGGPPEYAKALLNTVREAFPHAALRVLYRYPDQDPAFLAELHAYQDPAVYTLFGSGIPLSDAVARPQVTREERMVREILAAPVTEVNRADRPVLEKYFKINDWFGLPPGYTEKFYRK